MLLVILLSFLGSTAALSNVTKECIEKNNEELSNDFLLGSWYVMYRLSIYSTTPTDTTCTEIQFRKPSAEELEEYKEKYNDPETDTPYSFEDNPVIKTDSEWVGIVTGQKKAKFYLLDPKEMAVLAGGFSVSSYTLLEEGKYMMWSECMLRENIIFLLARDRFAPVDEMEELIKDTPELTRLVPQRLCANY